MFSCIPYAISPVLRSKRQSVSLKMRRACASPGCSCRIACPGRRACPCNGRGPSRRRGCSPCRRRTVYLAAGTGYIPSDDWGHGHYKGKLVVQGKQYDMSTQEKRSPFAILNETLCRFDLSTGEVAYGMHENMCLGVFQALRLRERRPDGAVRRRSGMRRVRRRHRARSASMFGDRSGRGRPAAWIVSCWNGITHPFLLQTSTHIRARCRCCAAYSVA